MCGVRFRLRKEKNDLLLLGMVPLKLLSAWGVCLWSQSPFLPKRLVDCSFFVKFFSKTDFVCYPYKKGNLWRDPCWIRVTSSTLGQKEKRGIRRDDKRQNATTTTTTKGEESKKRRRRRRHAMDRPKKNKKWALERFVWDSDKAVGMKIRGIRTEMEEKDEEEEEDEDDDDAKVNDLRNSPRLRSMVEQ